MHSLRVFDLSYQTLTHIEKPGVCVFGTDKTSRLYPPAMWKAILRCRASIKVKFETLLIPKFI